MNEHSAIAVAMMRQAGLDPIEPYPGASRPWSCVCMKCGAVVTPRYDNVKCGHGGCRPCAYRQSAAKNRESQKRGPEDSSWRGDAVGYARAHGRVREARGPAKTHPCVGCGATAADWSYNGGSEFERREIVKGSDVAYSTRIEDYSPRCKKCHKRFDNTIRSAG